MTEHFELQFALHCSHKCLQWASCVQSLDVSGMLRGSTLCKLSVNRKQESAETPFYTFFKTISLALKFPMWTVFIIQSECGCNSLEACKVLSSLERTSPAFSSGLCGLFVCVCVCVCASRLRG